MSLKNFSSINVDLKHWFRRRQKKRFTLKKQRGFPHFPQDGILQWCRECPSVGLRVACDWYGGLTGFLTWHLPDLWIKLCERQIPRSPLFLFLFLSFSCSLPAVSSNCVQAFTSNALRPFHLLMILIWIKCNTFQRVISMQHATCNLTFLIFG